MGAYEEELQLVEPLRGPIPTRPTCAFGSIDHLTQRSLTYLRLQIVFALRAIQHPASIPVSLASVYLIQQAMFGLISNFYQLANSTSSVSERLAAVRKLYEIGNIKNKVMDGTIPFPEDASQIKSGVALEFRYVYEFCCPFHCGPNSLC